MRAWLSQIPTPPFPGWRPSPSRLEAIAAWTIRDSPQTRYAIRAAAANPQITSFNGDTGEINSMAFSPDGTILATGSGGGTTDLWNTTTGKLTRLSTFNVFHAVNSLAFSPDGAVLAIGGDDGNQGLIGFWDVATHRQIGALIDIEVGSVASVAFSPDGKTLAISSGFEGCCVGTGGDSTIQLWNAATHKQIGSALVGTTATTDTYSVAFSPNGKILASGGDNGHDATAQLWNVATGRQIGAPILVSPSESVNSVAFSPDGKILATGDSSGVIRLWNVTTRREIGSPIQASSTGIVYSLAFSPDGTALADADNAGTTQLWNVITHRQIGITIVTSGVVSSVAFSPDGRTLATGTDQGAQLWDVGTDLQIGTTGTTGGVAADVASVAFSPDGKILATGDGDGTARLWNVGYLQGALGKLCRQAGGSITRSEWVRYVPSGPVYRDGCS